MVDVTCVCVCVYYHAFPLYMMLCIALVLPLLCNVRMHLLCTSLSLLFCYKVTNSDKRRGDVLWQVDATI